MNYTQLTYKILSSFFVLLMFMITVTRVNTTTATSSSIDLRNRVVGVRTALEGKDPFSYTWDTTDSIRLLDPLANNDYESSRLTVTPAALLLHIPLSYFSFSNIILIWFYIEWGLLILSVYFLSKAFPNNQKRIFLIFLFFALSPIWRLHISYGQIYIVYVFLVSLIVLFVRRSRFTAAFFFLGLLVALRPPYLILAAFLFVKRSNWTYTSVFILSVLLWGLVPLFAFNIHIWDQYLKGMVLMSNVAPDIASRGFEYLTRYPTVIENWKVPVVTEGFSPEYENSARGLLLRLFNIHVTNDFLVKVLIGINGLGLLYVQRLRQYTSTRFLFIGALFTLVSEYLLPARRYWYADIQWLIPISLAFIFIFRSKIKIPNEKS